MKKIRDHEMRFKVGEIVRVKPYSEISQRSSVVGFAREMKVYTGKKVKITGRHWNGKHEVYNSNGWNWEGKWLSKIEFFSDKDFEI